MTLTHAQTIFMLFIYYINLRNKKQFVYVLMSSKSFKRIINCYNIFCRKGEFVCLMFVVGLPQAKLTIFPTFATDEEKVQMVCGGHEVISECMFYPAGQENFLKPSDSCNFSITGANLIAWSQDKEISHINISCYYTVHALGKNESSPHSDRVSIRVRGMRFNHKLFVRQINCFFFCSKQLFLFLVRFARHVIFASNHRGQPN